MLKIVKNKNTTQKNKLIKTNEGMITHSILPFDPEKSLFQNKGSYLKRHYKKTTKTLVNNVDCSRYYICI